MQTYLLTLFCLSPSDLTEKSPGEETERHDHVTGEKEHAMIGVRRRKRRTAPPLGSDPHHTRDGRLIARPEDVESSLLLPEGKSNTTPLSEIMNEQLVRQLEDEDVVSQV